MKTQYKIIIKENQGSYYLFLQEEYEQGKEKYVKDIFINGKIARLDLKKQVPIIDSLNGQIGVIQFAPSKKEFRIIITRYAGENETYKMKA